MKNNNPLICLDFGHGGNKSGAVYNLEGDHYIDIKYKTIEEEDINVVIGSLVFTILSSYGYAVVPTRALDIDVSLKQRCMTANSMKADYFISIHANANLDAKVSGTEVYYNPSSIENKLMANYINNSNKKEFPNQHHRIIEGNFYVLNNTKMPAILIETGFMSNKEELQSLTNPEIQYRIAKSIVDGLIEYFNSK
jgi:N-acetylmuramoyl-L-alanine amidase